MVKIILTIILLFTVPTGLYAQQDPLDPFSFSYEEDAVKDSDKSAETLIREALMIMEDQPLDARTKLLMALKKDPESVYAMMLLSSYYSRHVNHYRLAMKYVKKAQIAFEKQFGMPPYYSPMAKYLHSDILRQLSQLHLSLDKYEQALSELELQAEYGYEDPYYYSSKSWILFKMGKEEEAIAVAREGIAAGVSIGANLNVLGILLSTTNRREESIKVFEQAIEYEKTLGSLGNPATPINNMGEVYREIFREDSAVNAWQRAMRLPDGCEHILPALNLFVVNLETWNLKNSKNALILFEQCIAKYPLRNGEEHQSLLKMAYARLHMYSGRVNEAVTTFEDAIENQQWFGQIGTNIEDLQAGLYSSLAQALEFKINHLKTAAYESLWQRAASLARIFTLKIRTAWYNRKARLLLSEKLNNFEDAYVRHSDSMIDYPGLGIIFRELPLSLTKKFIAALSTRDDRSAASLYYQAYLGEALLAKGNTAEARMILEKVSTDSRSEFDLAVKLRAKALLAGNLPYREQEYSKLTYSIFNSAPALIRNFGLKLPVQFVNISGNIKGYLNSAFMEGDKESAAFLLEYSFSSGKHMLSLKSKSTGKIMSQIVRDTGFQVASDFIDTTFREEQ
jgi:tetratricopeptide (TPR) repeat protein